jgi:hypothetical protein
MVPTERPAFNANCWLPIDEGLEGKCPALISRRVPRPCSTCPEELCEPAARPSAGALVSRVNQPVTRIVPSPGTEKDAGGALRVPSKCPPVWWVRAAGLAGSHPMWKMVNGSSKLEFKRLSDQRLL